MIKIKSAVKFITSLTVISFIVSCASSNLKKAESQFQANMMKHGHNSNKMDHDQHKNHSNVFGKRENAVTQLGENGHYKITLFCNESPIPLGRIHDWTVHIETQDGKPVENAKVFVFGGMPMHNHEFSTIPKVKEYLGNGDYRVEGIKFNMIGHWEMRFNIKRGRMKDRVIFKIHM